MKKVLVQSSVSKCITLLYIYRLGAYNITRFNPFVKMAPTISVFLSLGGLSSFHGTMDGTQL